MFSGSCTQSFTSSAELHAANLASKDGVRTRGHKKPGERFAQPLPRQIHAEEAGALSNQDQSRKATECPALKLPLLRSAFMQISLCEESLLALCGCESASETATKM